MLFELDKVYSLPVTFVSQLHLPKRLFIIICKFKIFFVRLKHEERQ